jgi:phospholipid transport system substrate-binding protein
MLIRTYSNAVLEHYKKDIEWEPLRLPAGATDVTVNSKVIRTNGPPVSINYRVHLVDGSWKVYDVTVDAISLVTNYRGTFTTEIRKSGLDALIAKLESKQAGG